MMLEGICAHCHGIMRGLASVGPEPVCHPDSGLDCYRLVTVYRHGLHCHTCMDVRVLEERQRRELATDLEHRKKTS
jgi:hypothetical protein